MWVRAVKHEQQNVASARIVQSTLLMLYCLVHHHHHHHHCHNHYNIKFTPMMQKGPCECRCRPLCSTLRQHVSAVTHLQSPTCGLLPPCSPACSPSPQEWQCHRDVVLGLPRMMQSPYVAARRCPPRPAAEGHDVTVSRTTVRVGAAAGAAEGQSGEAPGASCSGPAYPSSHASEERCAAAMEQLGKEDVNGSIIPLRPHRSGPWVLTTCY